MKVTIWNVPDSFCLCPSLFADIRVLAIGQKRHSPVYQMCGDPQDLRCMAQQRVIRHTHRLAKWLKVHGSQFLYVYNKFI